MSRDQAGYEQTPIFGDSDLQVQAPCPAVTLAPAQYTQGMKRYGTIAQYLSQSAPYFFLHAWPSRRSLCTAQQRSGHQAHAQNSSARAAGCSAHLEARQSRWRRSRGRCSRSRTAGTMPPCAHALLAHFTDAGAASRSGHPSPSAPHEPVPGVVDVPGHAPPAGDEELAPLPGLQGPVVLDRLGAAPEAVLLGVGPPEQGVAQHVERHDAACCCRAQLLPRQRCALRVQQSRCQQTAGGASAAAQEPSARGFA